MVTLRQVFKPIREIVIIVDVFRFRHHDLHKMSTFRIDVTLPLSLERRLKLNIHLTLHGDTV